MYGHSDTLTVTGFDPPADVARLGSVEDRERLDRIRNAFYAYHGETPDPLKRRKGETANDNVRINYSKLVVDTGVTALFGNQLEFEIDEGAAAELLHETVEGNGGGLLWQRLGMAGAIGGTAYYRIVIQEGYPRIVVLDPASVEILWDEDDHEVITGYIIAWLPDAEDRSLARRHLIQPVTDASWEVVEQESSESGEWRTLNREPWPYPFPPVGHAQNLPSVFETYGISDLEPDVLRLVSSIERVVSNINRLTRLYAHPRTWGRMVGDSLNLDMNPGSIIRLEHPQAELRNLEMSSDLQSSLRLYESLQSALFETTRIPAVAAGKLDSAGQLSSLAIRMMYAPLVAKTESKRRTYGNLITEMWRRVFTIYGVGDIRPKINWQEIVPVDDEGERRIALLDRQLGASKATILERLGYDAELEAERAAEEAAIAQENFMNTGSPPEEE